MLGGALALGDVLELAGLPLWDEAAWGPPGSTRFAAYAHRIWDALLTHEQMVDR